MKSYCESLNMTSKGRDNGKAAGKEQHKMVFCRERYHNADKLYNAAGGAYLCPSRSIFGGYGLPKLLSYCLCLFIPKAGIRAREDQSIRGACKDSETPVNQERESIPDKAAILCPNIVINNGTGLS